MSPTPVTRPPEPERGTQLLRRVSQGDREAEAELLELVYPDLRELARRFLAREQPGHTLQPTALVSEAWIRLFGEAEIAWRDRAHFFGIAARCLRQTLVQHARGRAAQKRGGAWGRVTLEGLAAGDEEGRAVELLALDDALERLAGLHPRQARVVELRWFGGLGTEEVAEALDVSERTVKSDWQVARMWLHRELGSR